MEYFQSHDTPKYEDGEVVWWTYEDPLPKLYEGYILDDSKDDGEIILLRDSQYCCRYEAATVLQSLVRKQLAKKRLICLLKYTQLLAETNSSLMMHP